MSVKLEISGNYFKITDGSNNPVRFPYRDIRFYANELNEYIEFFNNNLNGRLVGRIDYADEAAIGSVTIDTTTATHGTGTVVLASAVANTFSTGTAQCTSVVGADFSVGDVTMAAPVVNVQATGTVTCADVIPGDTVTINNLTYTAVAGAKENSTEFSADDDDDSCAADLTDAINSDTRSGFLGDITAVAVDDVVTFTSDVVGAGGNAVTLVSSDGSTLAVSGATFSGGVTADTVTANGLVYTCVSGAKADDTEFSNDTGNDEAATDLADSITNDVRAGTLDDITATSASAVVNMVQTVRGVAGDATTLVSSNGTRLAVSGATFASGADGDTVTINGLLYTGVVGTKDDDTQFSVDTGDNETAADLEDSITNDVRVGTLGVVSGSATTDTVTLTSDQAGTAGDATTLAQTGGNITLSGATFGSGVDADTVTFDGLVYTAVAGAKADDTEFSIDTSDDAAATDLADSIDDDVRIGTAPDNATATATTVTIVSENGGTVGNATTLVSSSGVRLAVSAATLTGGLNDASMSGILVDSVEIMSGAEAEGDYPDALATAVAANITANTSDPDYNAVAVGEVITITAADDDTDVNTFVVASTIVKGTTTDADMAGGTANIVDSAGAIFNTWAVLIEFLEDNTGGELII